MRSLVKTLVKPAPPPADRVEGGSGVSRHPRLRDPLEAAGAFGAAVGALMRTEDRGTDCALSKLRRLDDEARPIAARLMVGHAKHRRSHDPRLRQAALRLSDAFGDAYAQCLIQIFGDRQGPRRSDEAVVAMAGLLDHRLDDLVLRLYAYEQWMRSRWQALHGVFKLARNHALHRRSSGEHDDGANPSRGATVEQRYIVILLLDLANSGQFTPGDILRSRALMTRWSRHLALVEFDAAHPLPASARMVVVELESSEGLRPARGAVTASTFALDLSPLVAVIDADRRALEAGAGRAPAGSSMALQRRVKLLDRLEAELLRNPSSSRRRKAREQVAARAEVISGYPAIVEAMRGPAVPSRQSMAPEDVTCFGLQSIIAGSASERGSTRSTQIRDIVYDNWFVKDRSESGTRLRGRPSGPQCVLPGMLVSFRYAQDRPWILAFIRRLKKIAPTHVEIGVEHIGHGPRRITLQRTDAGGERPHQRTGSRRDRFAAIVLHGGPGGSGSPARTLLVPAREYSTGRTVHLFSVHNEYTLRLGAAIERRADFIWTCFDVTGQRPLVAARDPPRGDEDRADRVPRRPGTRPALPARSN
jgi:hypothetical protein